MRLELRQVVEAAVVVVALPWKLLRAMPAAAQWLPAVAADEAAEVAAAVVDCNPAHIPSD